MADTRFKKGIRASPLTEFVKGISPWNKGKRMSQEARMKMSIAKKGKSSAYKGPRPWLVFNKPHSEETKKKISESNLGRETGKDCPAYKNGKYTKEKRPRYWHDIQSYKYKHWRISIFERDGYKCQGCGQVGGYLTAHHIKSYALFPKLRYVVDNGITLCEECHKLTDNYKGRGKGVE